MLREWSVTANPSIPGLLWQVVLAGPDIPRQRPLKIKAMAPKTPQETFLDHVREEKTPLTIFLMNGVKLQGVVASFDNFSITLVRDGWSQLIYKHAVSTIMPAEPIKLEYE